MVICLERGAVLHMAQLMPLPLTVSCFSKIQIGFTFVVPAHLDSLGKGRYSGVCIAIASPSLDQHVSAGRASAVMMWLFIINPGHYA